MFFSPSVLSFFKRVFPY